MTCTALKDLCVGGGGGRNALTLHKQDNVMRVTSVNTSKRCPKSFEKRANLLGGRYRKQEVVSPPFPADR